MFVILCDVIFLERLQKKFEIDQMRQNIFPNFDPWANLISVPLVPGHASAVYYIVVVCSSFSSPCYGKANK